MQHRSEQVENVTILGSGPAGLTAAIYAGRAELEPLVIAGQQIGGQVAISSEIENYPGFPAVIGGMELYQQMQKQAERFGARVEFDEVTEVNLGRHPFKVKTWGHEYETKSVIVATGTTPRKLGVPGEEALRGRGVSYCATCDGYFYKGKVVVVSGGGDSAVEEAMYLTKFATKVYLVHRRDRLRAEPYMQARLFRNESIEVIWDSVVTQILGTDGMTGVRLRNVKTEQESDLGAEGIFIYIGVVPNTQFLNGQLELDRNGYVITDENMHTSVEGVFAAGDVQEPQLRQIATAVGSGARAAVEADKFISELEGRAYGEWRAP
jgi:thioredoxin reductase (NADPH)